MQIVINTPDPKAIVKCLEGITEDIQAGISEGCEPRNFSYRLHDFEDKDIGHIECLA